MGNWQFVEILSIPFLSRDKFITEEDVEALLCLRVPGRWNSIHPRFPHCTTKVLLVLYYPEKKDILHQRVYRHFLLAREKVGREGPLFLASTCLLFSRPTAHTSAPHPIRNLSCIQFCRHNNTETVYNACLLNVSPTMEIHASFSASFYFSNAYNPFSLLSTVKCSQHLVCRESPRPHSSITVNKVFWEHKVEVNSFLHYHYHLFGGDCCAGGGVNSHRRKEVMESNALNNRAGRDLITLNHNFRTHYHVASSASRCVYGSCPKIIHTGREP